MTAHRKPLRDYLRVPEVSAAERARVWREIAPPAAGAQGWTWRWWAVTAVTAAALLGWGTLRWQRETERAPLSRTSASDASQRRDTAGRRTVSLLDDGTVALLAPAATLQVLETTPERVRTRLLEGSALFDVVHSPKRVFLVEAADCVVAVLGTQFEVMITRAADGPLVSVKVTRGRVRIFRNGQEQATLAQGETWRESPVRTDSAPSVEPISPPALRRLPSAAPAASASPVDVASELFNRADQARLSGNQTEAAALFDQVRRNHQRHPLAALAAFELGRIRLDSLHQPLAAAEALSSALQLAPAAPFREDVEARRVEAYDAAGAWDACRQAQDAYLRRYAKGAHLRSVEQRCAPRK